MKLQRYFLLPLLPVIWMFSQASSDLVVTHIQSALTADSQTLAVSGTLIATLSNGGTAATSGGFRVVAFEDRNGNATYDEGVDSLLGSTLVDTYLAASDEVQVNISVAGTQVFRGNIIHVMVDASNQIPETDETNNVRHSGQDTFFSLPSSSDLNPQIKWIRDTFTEAPQARAVMNTPTVADINGDGVPDVVFTTYQYGEHLAEERDGILRVVSGDSGSPIFSITDPTLQTHPLASVTIADIDDDGRAELITLDEGCRMIVFEHDGAFKWRGAERVDDSIARNRCWASISAADLDGDGSVELVIGKSVYTSDGTLLWKGAHATGALFSGTAQHSVVADLDLDGKLEVIAGPTAYRADGTVYWNRENSPAYLRDGLAAIGNFDDDPNPEIIIRSDTSNNLTMLEHDGATKWTVAPSINYVRAGAPVVADFDSDGVPEIGIADRDNYIVYESDGAVKWSFPIIDTSSGVTSSSVFDFNNDGSAEVVFADEEFLYIVRGSDGTILFQTSRSSATAVEMPIVADVDGDGHADIVVPATPMREGTDFGIRVYSGANGNWANTRQVWNQHAYSVTNINDDLSVPRTVTPNWQVPGLNNFRANGLYATTVQPNSAPDLLTSLLRRLDDNFPAQTKLLARIGNGGASLAGVHRVEFRNGPGGAVLGYATTSRALSPGEYEDVQVIWQNPTSGPLNLVVTADVDHSVLEGDEDNNQASAQLLIGLGPQVTVDDLLTRGKDAGVDLRWTPVPGAHSYNIYRRTTDGSAVAIKNGHISTVGTYSDQRLTNNTTYYYQVRWVNAEGVESPLGTESSATPIPRSQRGDTPPTITTAPATRSRTGAAYLYQPIASDPDAGETLTWQIASAPLGISIDAESGRIDWIPGPGQGGAHRIHLRVSDSRDRNTIQSFNLFVETQIINTPPQISSTPLTSASKGRMYAYTLRAVDADAADLLSYRLESGPAGMSVHSATGLVQWLPTTLGSFPVSLQVRDLAGATATQHYTVAVQDLNRGPVITTVPPLIGTVAQTYSYSAKATDADAGDVLNWSLQEAPAGMSINPTTGLLLWTPTEVQVGVHTVTISVRDTVGAVDLQTWTLTMSPAINLPPVITSTAPTETRVAASYTYEILATDPEFDALQYTLTASPEGMTISSFGRIVWTPLPAQEGSHPVVVRIRDSAENNVLHSFTLTVGPVDDTPPTLTIHAPTGYSTLSADTTIVASVNDDNLIDWHLDYQISGSSVWLPLSQGVSNLDHASIATFPASLLEDNPYLLRLRAKDQNQELSVYSELRVLSGAYKPGKFAVSFEDLTIPVSGFPVVVKRHYNSAKPYATDFGPGWSLSFGDFDLRIDASYHAYVTLPNGRRVQFQFVPYQSNPIISTLENRYLAPAGSGDELVNLDCPQFLGGSEGFVCLGGPAFQTYRPINFRLKTREGLTFLLADGKVTEVVDRAGNRTLISATGIASWTGRNIVISRDGDGKITAIRDTRGFGLQYHYDGQGRLASITDQMGRQSSFDYSGGTHLLTAIHTPGGCTGARQEFDESGRVIAMIDAQGRRMEIVYDLVNRIRKVLLPGGAVVVEVYDTKGNMLSRDDGTGRVTSYAYDTSDRMTSIQLPTGRQVVYAYDELGNLISETNTAVDGATITTSYQYTALNLIHRIIRPNGDVVEHFYDQSGNLLRRQVRDLLNNVVSEHSFTWDSHGRRIASTDGSGVTTEYAYNSFSDMIRERLPSGATKNYMYDSSGNVIRYFDANGSQADLEYDGYNRVTRVRKDGQTLGQFTWNEFGKLATATDALNLMTTYGYDCSGDLASVTDALGQVHRYQRTLRGQVSAVTDALERESFYTYDAGGRELSRTTSGNATTTSNWTPDSVLASVLRPTGASITASYDQLGRLAAETRPDRIVTYSFDDLSRMTQVTDQQGAVTSTTAFTWDAANRLRSATYPNSRTVAVDYDLAGRRTVLTAPDGSVTNYTYNSNGLLAEVTTGGAWTRFTYDANGRRTIMLHSNGSSVTYTYTTRGLVKDLILRDGSNVVVRSWTLSYDATGRRTGALLNDGTVSWTYDFLDRLTAEAMTSTSLGNRSESWAYDAVGNRQHDASVYGAGDQLLSTASHNYSYDASGNQIQRSAQTRTFDVMNQLRSVGPNQYRYDVFGRRIGLPADLEYVYDSTRVLQIYQAGAARERYTYHPDSGELLFVTRAGLTHFFLLGLMDSVTAITDESGSVVHRYGYDAWGEIIQNSGTFSFISSSARYNPFTYNGAHWDSNSGSYLMQARSYDPPNGRFLQRDPIAGSFFNPATQHPYAYARNNPLRFVDPTGKLAATQYVYMVKENIASQVSGAIIGTGAGFSGATLHFLGDFLGRVTPTGFDAASAWQAAATATQSFSENIEGYFGYLNTDDISVADGIINGIQAGEPAGCGITAPGAGGDGSSLGGFGHGPQPQGVGGSGIQPTMGPAGPKVEWKPPAILGFQAGGLACGGSLANSWISANAPSLAP